MPGFSLFSPGGCYQAKQPVATRSFYSLLGRATTLLNHFFNLLEFPWGRHRFAWMGGEVSATATPEWPPEKPFPHIPIWKISLFLFYFPFIFWTETTALMATTAAWMLRVEGEAARHCNVEQIITERAKEMRTPWTRRL